MSMVYDSEHEVIRRGRRPLLLATMPRAYLLPQCVDLSDLKAEDMLHDSESMRRFERVKMGEDTAPIKSTILRFRHPRERHLLTAAAFEAVNAPLLEHWLLLRAGTIVDAAFLSGHLKSGH